MKTQNLVLNILMLSLLAVFSFCLPFGAWNLNPAWLILFARVSNIAFTNVHLTSIVAVSATAFYLLVRDRKTIEPFKWVAVVFAGAGIHEWMIFMWGWVIRGTPLLAWQDAIWFLAFISLGVFVANRRQRIVIGALAIYLFLLMGIYVAYFNDSDIEIGVYATNVVADNFIEVFGWVTAMLGFLFA